MDRGKVLERGTPLDMLEHPRHPRLVQFLNQVL
jgi:hypothetical protein